jgi:EpsI family protein
MIHLPSISLRTSLLVCFLSIAAAVSAVAATPRLLAVGNPPRLEQTVPRQFGDWKEKAISYVQVGLATGNEPSLEQPYDQVVMRTYVNSEGQIVMLALAWGWQRQEAKVHRPDLCYIAQGYKIPTLVPATFTKLSSAGPVMGKHMLATSDRGDEAVSYWIRIGNLYGEDPVATRFYIFKEGLAGRIPDGILVRASQAVNNAHDAQQAWPLLDNFLIELIAAVPVSSRHLMIR